MLRIYNLNNTNKKVKLKPVNFNIICEHLQNNHKTIPYPLTFIFLPISESTHIKAARNYNLNPLTHFSPVSHFYTP